MSMFLATVAGFFVILMVALSMFVHYLRSGLDSHSSVKVDPKPTEKY